MEQVLKAEEESAVYRLVRLFSASFFEGFYNAEFFGLDNIPSSGGFILASNHASFFDPPLAGYRVPRPIYYFARKTLMGTSFSAWLLGSLYTIPVDRDGPSDVTALRRVLKLLKAGNGLIVFPEGTRTVDGAIGDAQPGIGLLACKTQVPVVPVRLFGTFQAYGKHVKLPRFRESLSVVYGPPIGADVYDPGVGKERFGIAARRILSAIEALERPGTEVL